MTTAEIANVLQQVLDPELGIDIVSLGLIYDIKVDDGTMTVVMTTTSPHCPMGEALFGMADEALRTAFPAAHRRLGYANQPPWNVHMADMEALRQLGLVQSS